MQNGSRKEIDSRYLNLYKSKPSDPLKGKQMDGAASRTPSADRKVEYPLEYGNGKKK